MKMSEEKFYDQLESIEKIDTNVTNDWYPTVEELKDNGIEKPENTIKFFNLISFFATDPFTKQGICGKDDREYHETVSFCKNLILTIPLE